MEYLKKSFTVRPGESKDYRANYDRIFGKPPKTKPTRKRQTTKKRGTP